MQDMVQLENLFKQNIAENADQSDDLDSVATQPQQTQIVKISNAVEEAINGDRSEAFVLLTHPENGSPEDTSIVAKVAKNEQTGVSAVDCV